MKNFNLFLTFSLSLLLLSCSIYKAKYAEDQPKKDFGYPKNKEIEKTFYLLGDAGYSPPGGSSEGLIALKKLMDSVKASDDYTIILGDNVYPVGMPPKGAPTREQSEYRIDAQLDALENFKGHVIVIPGNHEWYNEGIDGLNRERDYFKEKFGDRLKWAPNTGCGLEVMDITDNIALILIDSQWFLEDWDKNPRINDNCSEIKTREAMLLEVASEIKKNENKTTIIAMHHPLYTNGVHGGQYNFDKNLYPSQKKIPVPILGSLAALIRTSGGVSIQDRQNERYKSMANRLITLAQTSDRLIFASGHEHTLQYIEHGNVKQIVSGAGSKASYVVLSNDGLFADPNQGFAVLDVFKDGSSWVSYYESVNQKPVLKYQKEVYAAPTSIDVSKLKKVFPDSIEASVYTKEETEKTSLYKSVWGQRYRELYGSPVKVKVANLDTLYGGLKPIRKGGGHQTKSIRLKDSLGRDYNMRRIKKSAVQFLQTVAFKDTPVQQQLENTVAENVINDFYTAAHPYAFLAVPKLSDAAGVYHTNPKLFYIPKQEALGKYNAEYGDELYMIVERPEEGWEDLKSFGSPNHDIISTSEMFDKLRRDEKYSLDEAAYVRARIFDMLIGDWDRHQDQWRWAEFEDKKGNRTFEPIPRDRDQAFSNFDGAFFGTLRGITGFANQFGVYSSDIKDVKWFNTAATGLDRELLQNVGKDTWIEQAKYIQKHVTDTVIEQAFKDLPPETLGKTTDYIKKSLKGRRGNIVDIARRYYNYLAKLAIVTGTDKDDAVDVIRLPDGNTRVKISRLKDGQRAEIISDKIYKRDETNEIWVYALDDDDQINVSGNNKDKNQIFVRVIGGQNNDIYKVAENSGKKVKIYDYKTMPSTIKSEGKAKFRFQNDYEINTFDKDKKIFKGNSLLPGVGYNPDEGFKIGIKSIYTVNGFKRDPFTAQHTVSVGWYSATGGFSVDYKGEFADILGDYNLVLGADFTSPAYSMNFFGIGNETPNYDDEKGFDYNRVKINKIGANFGFQRKSPFGSYFGYMANFESVKIDPTANRFITADYSDANSNYFNRKYFAGLEAIYRYESYDYNLNPTRGMKFELDLGTKLNLQQTNRFYGYFKPYLGFYNAVTRDRKLVVKSHVDAQFNMGDDFEFYQAAFLGGETGLRGYRLNRFAGKSAFGTGADLRYSFDQFKTSFLPFQIGVYGGYDLGRVWVKPHRSKEWHDSYGGGFWVNSAQAINANFSYFWSGEGGRFSFALGLRF
ncbi:MAG: metallophosphoesterase [Gillisia sp.]